MSWRRRRTLPVNDFGLILEDLNEAGLRYVVVGGLAVIGHGVVRATKDVDVVIAADDETALALAAVLRAWEATRPDGTAETRDRPSPGWPLQLRTRHGLVELLAESNPPLDLAGLLARSATRTIDGTRASLCSLADLVALKRQAGRSQDLDDLAKLQIAHGELPETT